MSKEALYVISVAGMNVTANFSPILLSLEVSDKVGTHSDTARIEVDDTGGMIAMPQKGAEVTIALGWKEGGARLVFEGTVDEVRSSGSRGGGRTLSVTAKGVDTTKKPKEGQQRHFDEQTVQNILTQAGQYAGVSNVVVDPKLAGVVRKYFEMRDESFIHMGERLAREIGGNFAVRGKTAYMTAKGGTYTSFVLATAGLNMHSWDIKPVLGRPQYNKARARWYDKKEALWKEVEVAVELEADARYEHRYAKPDEQEAQQQTENDKATSERDAGEGTVTIEGDPAAIPDGLCIVAGARSGVDGAYRIESVTHSLSRGSGFTTTLQLKSPGSGGGGG